LGNGHGVERIGLPANQVGIGKRGTLPGLFGNIGKIKDGLILRKKRRNNALVDLSSTD
jgi:hypothetical protein